MLSSGEQFYSWTVLRKDPNDRQKRRDYYWVRCVCGIEKSVSANDFKRGLSKSCGCQKRVRLTVGAVYGSWTVVKEIPEAYDGHYWYTVRCVCGTERELYASKLTKSRSTQCVTCSGKEKQFEDCGVIPGGYIRHVQKSAQRRGIPFEITGEQMLSLWENQKGQCALSGRPLTMRRNMKDSSGTASLDRIQSEQGYSLGNCQWTHKDVNKMKLNHSESYFFELCRDIVNYKDETKRLRGSRPWLKDRSLE